MAELNNKEAQLVEIVSAMSGGDGLIKAGIQGEIKALRELAKTFAEQEQRRITAEAAMVAAEARVKQLQALEAKYRSRADNMRAYADKAYFKDGTIVPEGERSYMYRRVADEISEALAGTTTPPTDDDHEGLRVRIKVLEDILTEMIITLRPEPKGLFARAREVLAGATPRPVANDKTLAPESELSKKLRASMPEESDCRQGGFGIG